MPKRTYSTAFPDDDQKPVKYSKLNPPIPVIKHQTFWDKIKNYFALPAPAPAVIRPFKPYQDQLKECQDILNFLSEDELINEISEARFNEILSEMAALQWVEMQHFISPYQETIKGPAENLPIFKYRENLLNGWNTQRLDSKVNFNELAQSGIKVVDFHGLGLTRLPYILWQHPPFKNLWDNLETLDLSNNDFYRMPHWLKHLKNLKELNFANNPVKIESSTLEANTSDANGKVLIINKTIKRNKP